MLQKLFAVGFVRSPKSKDFRRPELEILEDRVPPALVVSGAPAGPFVVGGSFDAVPGVSMNIASQNSPLFFGEASDYPTRERGYYNVSDASVVNVLAPQEFPVISSPSNIGQNVATGSVPFALAPAPLPDSIQVLGQMEQLVGSLATIAARTQDPSQVFNLVVDEWFAAVGTFALAEAHTTGANNSAVQGNLTAQLAAIQNNPVYHTPVGQLLGTAVYDTTLYMLAINQGARA